MRHCDLHSLVGSSAILRFGAFLGAALIALAPVHVAAQEAPPADAPAFPPEFRTLGLGLKADEITTEGYDSFACGSNGNVPLKALTGWTDFKECEPDENGLYEVAVEFGNRTERMSQLFHDQYDEELWIQQFGGTRIANFPVVMSLLFDEDGISRGFRAVTDSRAPIEDRGRSYLLRFRVYSHYGEGDWDCMRYQPRNGHTPVGKTYIDEVCSRSVDGKLVRVEAHVYRRPGQTGMDSRGMFEQGQFESLTRWEVWDASYPIKLPPEDTENGTPFHGQP